MSRKGAPVIKLCEYCKMSFDAREKNKGRGLKRMLSIRYCSRGCMSRHRAETHNQENHHSWKGGKFTDNGYVRINKYMGNGVRKMPLEHDLIIEKEIGRSLRDDEVVHHIDRDRSNNRIENLLLMTRGEHSKLHYEEGDYDIGDYKHATQI